MTDNMISITPNLMVKDVNKTLEFYTEILGFNQVATIPETGRFIWGMVKSGEVSFMFQETESIKEEYPQIGMFEKGGGLTFYIHVNNLKELFDRLKNKVTIIKKIHKKPYGAIEFAIEDCNGYILTFSQHLE